MWSDLEIKAERLPIQVGHIHWSLKVTLRRPYEISYKNIPILPEAFLTFASKSSVGPSYAANGQEDHETCTNLKDGTIIMANDCYFASIAQCPCVLRNVQVYCAMSKIKIDPYDLSFDRNLYKRNCFHKNLNTKKKETTKPVQTLKRTPPYGRGLITYEHDEVISEIYCSQWKWPPPR